MRNRTLKTELRSRYFSYVKSVDLTLLGETIQQGIYTIGPQQDYTIQTGRNRGRVLRDAMTLTPQPGTDTSPRGGYLIHGDNSCGCNSASAGCVILPNNVRDKIAGSGDNMLRVVP